MSQAAPQFEIDSFFETGQNDPLYLRFPGTDHLDRMKGGRRALAEALSAEVRLRESAVDARIPHGLPEFGSAGRPADRRTLFEELQGHPVFKQRCEIDGLDAEEYVLTGVDLEPDAGGPLDIEQPQTITTKPLSPKDQDDRVRMVFGLTSNDPLPDVDDESLKTYHRYLSQNLVFPFAAEYGAEYGRPERVKVVGLGDSGGESMIDDQYGILCEARLTGQIANVSMGELHDAKGQPNRQTVDDYRYWFHNWS